MMNIILYHLCERSADDILLKILEVKHQFSAIFKIILKLTLNIVVHSNL